MTAKLIITILVSLVEGVLSQKEARFTNHKKAFASGILLRKFSGQEGVNQNEEVFKPLFSLFTLQQAKRKTEVWSCIWEEKDWLKKVLINAVISPWCL